MRFDPLTLSELKRALALRVMLGLSAGVSLAVMGGCDGACKSQAESVTLEFAGKCGPDAQLTISTDTACNVTIAHAEEADLPTSGKLNATGTQPAGAILSDGFNFFSTDGGVRTCTARPDGSDAGLNVVCHQSCNLPDGGDGDGGDNCDLQCTGTLAP